MAAMEQGAPMPMADHAQEEAPEAGGAGNPAQTLIKGVSVAMGEVAKAIPKIGGSEDDVAAMGDLISQYQQLITKILQGDQGEPGEAQAAAPQQASAMGGPSGVPMGR